MVLELVGCLTLPCCVGILPLGLACCIDLFIQLMGCCFLCLGGFPCFCGLILLSIPIWLTTGCVELCLSFISALSTVCIGGLTTILAASLECCVLSVGLVAELVRTLIGITLMTCGWCIESCIGCVFGPIGKIYQILITGGF